MKIESKNYIRSRFPGDVTSILGVVHDLDPVQVSLAFDSNCYHDDVMLRATRSRESGFYLPESIIGKKRLGYKALICNFFDYTGFVEWSCVYDPTTNNRIPRPPSIVGEAMQALRNGTLSLAKEHMPDVPFRYTSYNR